MAAIKTYPPWRKGWPWALIKCAVTVVVFVITSTIGLRFLLQELLDRLPRWIPSRWVHWFFEFMARSVWFLGPALGLALGLVASFGIVMYDARRGRLTRVR